VKTEQAGTTQSRVHAVRARCGPVTRAKAGGASRRKTANWKTKKSLRQHRDGHWVQRFGGRAVDETGSGSCPLVGFGPVPSAWRSIPKHKAHTAPFAVVFQRGRLYSPYVSHVEAS
jgi:hypothetical protein